MCVSKGALKLPRGTPRGRTPTGDCPSGPLSVHLPSKWNNLLLLGPSFPETRNRGPRGGTRCAGGGTRARGVWPTWMTGRATPPPWDRPGSGRTPWGKMAPSGLKAVVGESECHPRAGLWCSLGCPLGGWRPRERAVHGFWDPRTLTVGRAPDSRGDGRGTQAQLGCLPLKCSPRNRVGTQRTPRSKGREARVRV